MNRTIIILLVAVFAAIMFAMAACSKPEPAAQPAPPAATAIAPAAAAPTAPGAAEKKPEAKASAPASAPSSAAPGLEKTPEAKLFPPVQVSHPDPGMDKKVWPKNEGPDKQGK